MKHIYIMLSSTKTKFAKAIRIFGKQKYNHASLIVSDDYSEIYAYARPQHNAVLLAGLVEENLERYTLGKEGKVPVAVYKIEVSDSEYGWIMTNIKEMLYNPEYIYNLFSVLSHPIFKGFSVEKSFTCIEFIVYLLRRRGMLTEKKCCHYTPDDLIDELKEFLVYEGDVRGLIPDRKGKRDYFAPFSWSLFKQSVRSFCVLTKRTFCNRVTR